jgi:hypothetical protein
MKAERITTLKADDLKNVEKSKFERFLSEYSEIAFIYTAVPAFLLMMVGQITGILLFVHRDEYYNCKNTDDMLMGFLIGQMIFYYSFTIIYANLLFQLVPYLYSLTASFISVSSYFLANTAWSLWGIDVLVETGCDESVYAGIASFTIAFSLMIDLVLAVSFVVLVVLKRRSQPAQQEKEEKEENKIKEQKSAPGEKEVHDNSGWNEENLDDF